jgi:NAD(P)-dependent dehydrogenase (short-subunit alcohol dehydrogenase family)
MMTKSFKGKVALVTGASSGIGRASALTFAREGARVVVADIDVNGGEQTVQAIKERGGDAIFVKTDVSKAAEVEALINKAVANYGRLDFAFNNAGIEYLGGGTAECTEKDWDSVINTNLKGVWLCMKYEIPQMVKGGGGAIVNTSSVLGLVNFPDNAPYTISKLGVIALTKCAALEYAEAGIRINAVCPGAIQTPLLERVSATGRTLALGPMQRVGTPEEVAEAVIWLCSDAASFVTGHAMPVDGGFLAS